MPMRLQEVHPALVHFPIAILPLTVAADVAARVTGDGRLSWLGRWGMVASAASALAAGLAGLIAQEEVNVAGASMDTLITHRSLNLSVVALTSTLAARRLREDRPGVGYLAAAAAGVGLLLYSGYLGGKVVYEYGVGVGPADGLWQGGGPALTPSNVAEVASKAAHDLGMGVKHLVQETAQLKLVPSIFGGAASDGTPASSAAPQPAPSAAAGD